MRPASLKTLPAGSPRGIGSITAATRLGLIEEFLTVETHGQNETWGGSRNGVGRGRILAKLKSPGAPVNDGFAPA